MNATTLAYGVAARTATDTYLCVASTREQRKAVFELVYQSYLNAGLCESDSIELRCTPYQLLTTTDIFFAQLHEEVVCTLSLVRDGKLGLPMEDLYAAQVEERRAAGLRLAEVSCLADRRNDPPRFFELFCDLSRLMVQLAEKQDIDQLLIAVHPRHAALYTRYMAFKKIGEQRDYSTVNGNPAVPLCLDLNEIRANHPPCWEKFFGDKIPTRFLQPKPITNADRNYFLGLLENTRHLVKQSEFESYEDKVAAEFSSNSHATEAILCA